MELFKLLGTISIDNSKANQAIEETTKKADDSEKKQSGAFKKIGSAAVGLAKGVAGAGAVLGGAFVVATEGTREYRKSMGMLETAFTTSGHSAETAKQTYSDLNAVLGDSGQATEASQQLALLTDSEKELDNWTNILTGVYATFGEALPVEGLAEAANHTAKIGEVQGSLADALEWSGISVDSFNESLASCNTEQERQKLITETLNGLYAESGQKYKEVNADVIEAERANENLSNAMSELGAVGEPIMTLVKEKVAEMVSIAVPKIESLINKVKDLVKWFKENKNTVDIWVASILGATVAIAGFVAVMKFSAVMKAAKTAIMGVRGAMVLLNATMKANPIGLVISLIMGLVTAFIYLWNNNEDFRKFWINLWKKIKSTTSDATKWIKNKFDDLKGAVSNVKKRFEEIKDAISDKINDAKDSVKSAIDKIKGFFPLKVGKIFSNLKVPKIEVSGGKAPFGIGGFGKKPNIDVKWNAEGAVFDKPTIFSTSAGLQGVGESGAEAIAPIDTLKAYVAEAVESKNKDILDGLENQISRLILFLQDYFPVNHQIMLDTGILAGQLAPEMNERLSDIFRNNQRGNTR